MGSMGYVDSKCRILTGNLMLSVDIYQLRSPMSQHPRYHLPQLPPTRALWRLLIRQASSARCPASLFGLPTSVKPLTGVGVVSKSLRMAQCGKSLSVVIAPSQCVHEHTITNTKICPILMAPHNTSNRRNALERGDTLDLKTA